MSGVSTMTAAVFHGTKDVRIEDVPKPVGARPGELLLEVATVGVCGSDVAEWDHGPIQIPSDTAHRVTGHHGPMVMGHEFSGRVVAVGQGVDPGWLGALVASCGAHPCGECQQCLSGATNRCLSYSAVGLHRDGALAPYVSTPVGSCVRVDDLGLSADEAALAQPLGIAVHVGRRGRAAAGETAVVLGVGGIGAFLVHVLTAWGIDVVALDLDKERLDIATELGASRVVLAGSDDDAAAILDLLGDAPDVVFEVSGSAAGLETALNLCPVGGRIVLVGVQKKPTELLLRGVTLREQEIIGTNALIRETDFPEAIRLLGVRRGGWSMVAPTVLPLAQLVEGALEPMAAGRSPAIKLLIDPRAHEARDSVPGAPSWTEAGR